jgi:farnesyl-diphosphate farnesyltransferase
MTCQSQSTPKHVSSVELVNVLDTDGWTFHGNRLTEKDRNLLVNFDNVIIEFRRLKETYQLIIKDVTDQMGKGLADFWAKRGESAFRIDTIHDYDLYCYDAAVSVGEGISKMFIEAGFAKPDALNHGKSMALFFQRVNAIDDVKEDYEDNRQLWPREIWSKYVDTFDDLFKPEFRHSALDCASELILDALQHAEGCVLYCSGLTERSVFNCATITVLMAVILLRFCFCNEALFCEEIDIPKQQMRELMSILVQERQQFYILFQSHVYCIRQKADLSNPNCLNIVDTCEKVL